MFLVPETALGFVGKHVDKDNVDYAFGKRGNFSFVTFRVYASLERHSSFPLGRDPGVT